MTRGRPRRHENEVEVTMSDPTGSYREIAQTVSARLKSLRASTPEVMKGSTTSAGRRPPPALDAKTRS